MPEWKSNPPSLTPVEQLPAPALRESSAAPLQATHIYTDSTGISGLDSFRCPATATLTMTVPADITIRDLDVGINLEHTWRGDLRVWLKSPLGTEVLLVDSSMDDDNDNYDVRLDDESPNVLNDADDDAVTPPYYDRTAAPDGALSSYDGENALGDWALSICDMWGGDTGDFNLWTLFFEEVPSTAAIGNLVWEDLDADGFQDPGKPGVADVTVNLLDGDGAVISTTATAADGSYLFADLPPGDYAIGFEPPPGFLFSPQDQGDDARDSDADLASGRTVTTALEIGEIDLSWDAGMYRAAGLGDTVWEDLNADGIQDMGEPGLEGVTVALYNGAGAPLSTTTTVANGFYLFGDLDYGDHAVGYDLLPGYRFSPQDQGDDDAVDSDADETTGRTMTTTLEIGEGDFSWDAGMYRPAELGDYVWDDLNADGVQDLGEPGVPGVTVTLRHCSLPFSATATTIAGGFYSFADLVPGSYYLEFELPPDYSFSPPDQGGDDAVDSDVSPATGQTPCTSLISGQNDDRWDAGIYRLATLGDYVWEDSNINGIQGTGESGIPGVTVNVFQCDGSPAGSTTTDASGYYSFTTLLPGSYYAEFILPAGYAFSPPNQGGNPALDSDADPVTGQTSCTILTSGEDDLSWDAGMFQAAEIGDYVWEDTNADGQQNDGATGIQGVSVSVYQCDGALVASTATNASGYYAFTGLAPGGYSLTFELPSGYVFSPRDQGDDATDSDTDPDTGQTACTPLTEMQTDLTWDAGMYRPAGLGNLVWDDLNADGLQNDGATGLSGVTVTLLSDAGVYVAETTTSGGAYNFSGLTPGDYYLVFSPPAGYSFSPPDVGANDAIDSDAHPDTGQTISTTLVSGENELIWDAGLYRLAAVGNYVWEDLDGDGVQDPDEPGLSGITVTVNHCTTPYSHTTNTDAGGLYSFTNLAPGDYSLLFELPDGYAFTLQNRGNDAADSDPDPTTGETACTALTSGENDTTWDAGAFQGAGLGDFVWDDLDADGIQDAGERGMPDVPVTLYTSLGVYITETVTSGTGLFRFDNVAPGDYLLVFDRPADYGFSPQYQGGDPARDSNADPATGRTGVIPLVSAGDDLSWDAGIYLLAELGDRVWEDLNEDGIQDPGEPGLSAVTVTLYSCAAQTVVDWALTDSGGLYLFTDLPVGNYYIGFESPAGFAISPQDQGGDDAKDSDADPTTGETICTGLTPDESDDSWDAGMYRLPVYEYIYLPLVAHNYSPPLPDLVVKQIIATPDDVQVVIENQGNGSAGPDFWVDAYIDPATAPGGVNDTWQMVGDLGIAWGVTMSLAPGEVITLTRYHAYYDPANSQVVWPLAANTPIYAQVDSAHTQSSYGAILEEHESTGGPYNNIAGPVYVTRATAVRSLPSLGRHLHSP